SKAHTAKLDAKGKGKRKADDDVDGDDVQQPKQKRNKQRVLLLSSRGITHRMRHLMNDLETLLPHVKKDSDLNNCNNTLYFEARRHEDLYMWATKTPNGPSIKLHVQNVHTMDELKMNRKLYKRKQRIFGVPPLARKAKPFIDHVLTFSILDNKIWFRNFQIMEKDPLQPNGPPQTLSLRLVPDLIRHARGDKYRQRKEAQEETSKRKVLRKRDEDALAVSKVFA
ncbi:hypothetical protein BD769DRAFT_1381827, partial [Suillus cothurnatus]